MRQLDGITDSFNMSLSKLWEKPGMLWSVGRRELDMTEELNKCNQANPPQTQGFPGSPSGSTICYDDSENLGMWYTYDYNFIIKDTM